MYEITTSPLATPLVRKQLSQDIIYVMGLMATVIVKDVQTSVDFSGVDFVPNNMQEY